MTYSPHTHQDRADMLAAVGLSRIEDLFSDVPAGVRFPVLDIPEPLSEMETLRELADLADANGHGGQNPIFLGAGAYHRFTPSVVNHMILRGEFLTAYTPYQPE